MLRLQLEGGLEAGGCGCGSSDLALHSHFSASLETPFFLTDWALLGLQKVTCLSGGAVQSILLSQLSLASLSSSSSSSASFLLSTHSAKATGCIQPRPPHVKNGDPRVREFHAISTSVPASSPLRLLKGGRGSSGGGHPLNLEVFHFLALHLIEVPLPILDPQLWPLPKVRFPPWADLGGPRNSPTPPY